MTKTLRAVLALALIPALLHGQARAFSLGDIVDAAPTELRRAAGGWDPRCVCIAKLLELAERSPESVRELMELTNQYEDRRTIKSEPGGESVVEFSDPSGDSVLLSISVDEDGGLAWRRLPNEELFWSRIRSEFSGDSGERPVPTVADLRDILEHAGPGVVSGDFSHTGDGRTAQELRQSLSHDQRNLAEKTVTLNSVNPLTVDRETGRAVFSIDATVRSRLLSDSRELVSRTSGELIGLSRSGPGCPPKVQSLQTPGNSALALHDADGRLTLSQAVVDGVPQAQFTASNGTADGGAQQGGGGAGTVILTALAGGGGCTNPGGALANLQARNDGTATSPPTTAQARVDGLVNGVPFTWFSANQNIPALNPGQVALISAFLGIFGAPASVAGNTWVFNTVRFTSTNAGPATNLVGIGSPPNCT